GAWGSATEPSPGQAWPRPSATARRCPAENRVCAQSRAIKGGWLLATRCGDTNIVAAEMRLADAERAARERETDLREHYARDLPPCRRVLTINPRGGAMVAKPRDDAGTATD